MDVTRFTHPIDLRAVSITDPFWQRETELVRREVIPYQWEALNDRIPGAEKSWCMHNFRLAGRIMAQYRQQGAQYTPQAYTYRGYDALPDDPAHPDEDKFYGFVFQDTDFSKWIEAVGYSLIQHPDKALEATADEAIDVVCAAQTPEGYLDTYYIINGMDGVFQSLRDHHELYCLGHLIEGAVSYYQATGKDKLLRAACRFADYVADFFGTADGQCKGYPGHEIAEMALVRLYEVTKDEKYLRLSRFFINERGQEPNYFVEEERRNAEREHRPVRSVNLAYHQAVKPVREQDEAMGHAVRAVYLYSGMADVARMTGDDSLKSACERLWRNIVQEKLYITGGIGATQIGEAFSYAYDLPNDTAYSETCAAIGLAFFARRMLQMSPQREYGDVMELALYNTVLSGMALDGKSFFYVNPLSVVPSACHADSRLQHVKTVRQKWFGCACCPPNIARMVESVQQYAYTVADDASTLYVHLYMGGVVSAKLGGSDVSLEVRAGMPWNGTGAITVTLPSSDEGQVPESFALALRLPAWAGGESAADSIHATGEKDSRITRTTRDGYLYLTGTWRDGDVIDFDFPMPVRMIAANPLVREDAGKVAFIRGPLAYCAEGTDNGDNLHLLHADAETIAADPDSVKVNEITFHAQAAAQDERGLGEVEPVDLPMVTLTIPAWRESSQGATDKSLYALWQPAQRQPTEVTLIPYFAWANRGETEMTVFLRS